MKSKYIIFLLIAVFCGVVISTNSKRFLAHTHRLSEVEKTDNMGCPDIVGPINAGLCLSKDARISRGFPLRYEEEHLYDSEFIDDSLWFSRTMFVVNTIVWAVAVLLILLGGSRLWSTFNSKQRPKKA